MSSGCSRISLAFSLVARRLSVWSTFAGTSREGLLAESNGSDCSEPVDFRLEILDTRLAGVVFHGFEPRDDTLGGDDQQVVHAIADLGGDGRSDPPVDVVEEPAQGRVHDALQFPFGGQFHAQVPEPLTGMVKEALFLLDLQRGLLAQPAFEIVLVLSGGEAPTRMPPDLEEMQLPRPAVPSVLLGEVPEQAQLPCDERANLAGNAVQTVRDVAEVSQRLQQQRHATAVGFSAAGQYHQLQVGWRQQEVLDQFLVRISGLELGIGSAHGDLPASSVGCGADCRK